VTTSLADRWKEYLRNHAVTREQESAQEAAFYAGAEAVIENMHEYQQIRDEISAFKKGTR
jgi:hypothetical protein